MQMYLTINNNSKLFIKNNKINIFKTLFKKDLKTIFFQKF